MYHHVPFFLTWQRKRHAQVPVVLSVATIEHQDRPVIEIKGKMKLGGIDFRSLDDSVLQSAKRTKLIAVWKRCES